MTYAIWHNTTQYSTAQYIKLFIINYSITQHDKMWYGIDFTNSAWRHSTLGEDGQTSGIIGQTGQLNMHFVRIIQCFSTFN